MHKNDICAIILTEEPFTAKKANSILVLTLMQRVMYLLDILTVDLFSIILYMYIHW